MDPADPAVAAAALERLREWGGPRLVSDMTAIFAAEMPRRLTELGAALQRSDSGAALRAAHSIKSSAGQFGAVALAQLAGEAERLAESSETAAARELLVDMDNRLAQFLSWLSEYRPTRVTDP